MILILKKSISSRRYLECSTELETENATRPLQFLVPLYQQARNGVITKASYSPFDTQYINTKTYPVGCTQQPTFLDPLGALKYEQGWEDRGGEKADLGKEEKHNVQQCNDS